MRTVSRASGHQPIEQFFDALFGHISEMEEKYDQIFYLIKYFILLKNVFFINILNAISILPKKKTSLEIMSRFYAIF